MEEILKQRFKELNDEDLQEVEPLIILDGVVTGTNLGGINPNSIEKIEVLKMQLERQSMAQEEQMALFL